MLSCKLAVAGDMQQCTIAYLFIVPIIMLHRHQSDASFNAKVTKILYGARKVSLSVKAKQLARMVGACLGLRLGLGL